MTTIDFSFERVVIDAVDRREAVLEVIRAATRSLRLSIFRCDDRPVLSALVEARARGVCVEVLMTRKVRREKVYFGLLRQHLCEHGVSVVRSPLHSRYHAKFVVADDRIALVSSANFTARCFTRTSDFIVVTDDRAVVGGLTRLFEADCGLAGPAAAAADRLIVGPDHARTAFAAFLGSAERSIRIADRKLRDPAFRALLLERRAAGIDVRVLDRRKVGTDIAHGKLCIVDGRAAIIGSTALASKTLGRGRELSVRLDRPALVARLTAYFDTAYASAVRVERSRVA